MFDPSYNSAMQQIGFGDAPNCAKCGLAMSPENAKRRPELFLHDSCLPDELKEAYDSVEPAHERIVTEAEHLAGRLKYLESLHRLRQESGITAAMLRDGRAKGFIDAFQQILRWCDRSGEEPEGQCLHEIEQICRKQLGLELLKVSERVVGTTAGKPPTCCAEHANEYERNTMRILEEARSTSPGFDGEIPNRRSFEDELVCLLNKYSKENGSNTPDFILAEYLIRCLETWNQFIAAREDWYGRHHLPGRIDSSGGVACKPSEIAIEIAARVWCDQEMGNCTMDQEAALEIAKIIDGVRHNQAECQSMSDLAASGGIVDAP